MDPEDQMTEGITAVARFERACHSALVTMFLVFTVDRWMDSIFGHPLLNKQVALGSASAMLWYSAAGAAATVLALLLADCGRRRSAACRAAACAGIASAAFIDCVFCGLLVHFLLTAHGLGPILVFLVVEAAALFVAFAARDVCGFLDVLRGDGADGGKEEE